MAMSEDSASLTGVWDGSTAIRAPPVHPETPFTVVLFESSGSLSGTVHETMQFRGGPFDPGQRLPGGRGRGRTCRLPQDL
jgi:hypothetical protein